MYHQALDEVDAVPRPRKQRPKDSFQNELQSKLRQRKSQGLATDITDSEDDGLGSLGNSDYLSKRAARPGSAKYRSDKSPDLSRGLGTTTMRARDLTQLLGQSGGHSDEDDEEVMAATLGKSRGAGSWQPPTYKTPSPKQDSKMMMKRSPSGGSPKDQSHLDSLLGRKTPSAESPRQQSSKLDSIFGRKTPTAESPKDQTRFESIYGRKTPTRESPKDSSKLESIYGRKTPSKESPKDSGKSDPYDRKSPGKDRTSPGLSKEEIIFGRKTPTSDGRWQPPSFRNVSPNSSPDHSRGSRGVTPTEALLDPINETPREKVTPRLQRGERVRNDDSPNRQVSFGEKPKPQARSRSGDKKSASTRDGSPGQGGTSMKRATPTMDLFGKTRTGAAQEVEEYMESDRKGRLSRDSRKTPELTRSSAKDRQRDKSNERDGFKRPGSREKSPVNRYSKVTDGKKTPTKDLGRKSPLDKKGKEEEVNRKGSVNQNSSLLDFLTGGRESQPKLQEDKRDRKLKAADDDIDDLFAANRKHLQRKSPIHERMSPDPLVKRPSISTRKTDEGKMKESRSLRDENIRARDEEKENEEEKGRGRERRKSQDASSVCEEIPPDPHAKLAKAEETSKKSGKQTTERAKADNIIDAISQAQTMTYIEPAKKMRPITAEAKVQHRPKPRYGTLPGNAPHALTEQQFNSTSDIRDAIYEEWYAERIKQAKQKKREEERKKREEEEKKKKEEEEKQQEAMLSYKSWTEQKKETDKEKMRKKRKENEKINKELEDKELKKQEAKKLFETWKQSKDAQKLEETKNKRDKEDDEREAKRLEDKKKREEKETAFRGWERRKKLEMKDKQRKLKEEKKTIKQKQDEEEKMQRRKEEEAFDRYNTWLENKEKQKSQSKRRTHYFGDEEEERPAWSPASRTIPFGR